MHTSTISRLLGHPRAVTHIVLAAFPRYFSIMMSDVLFNHNMITNVAMHLRTRKFRRISGNNRVDRARACRLSMARNIRDTTVVLQEGLQLSDVQVAEIKKAFALFDRDNDGFIDAADLKPGTSASVGVSPLLT